MRSIITASAIVLALATGDRSAAQDPAPKDEPLYGFADLHAHPAAHLAFGADGNGNEGIFWGKPGHTADAPDFQKELPTCDGCKHSGMDLNVFRHEARKTVLSKLGGLTERTHAKAGWPSYADWPNAESLIHQQMHVAWIHRAWEGGLRLMVATAVDNRLLSAVWNAAINPGNGQIIKPAPGADLDQARRQLKFIRKMAEDNSSWMQIVTNASEARAAVARGKLALILGVEMDHLSPEEILTLHREEGLRHVTPIHLIDNAFGGAAVYNDTFNVNNYYFNGRFFKVVADPHVAFHLEAPGYPRFTIDDKEGFHQVMATPAEYKALGYDTPRNQGQRNATGLDEPELKKLMAAGMLIDLAHMAEATQGDAVALARRFNYPMMNTHTGLREDNRKAASERLMKKSHAVELGRLGGVIGLGTEVDLKGMPFVDLRHDGRAPAARLTGEQGTWAIATPHRERQEMTVNRLNLRIRTGGDDLRRASKATALILCGRRIVEADLNGGEGWGGNTDHTVSVDLPEGTKLDDLNALGLRHVSGKPDPFATYDNWNVDALEADYVIGGTLVKEAGRPLVRFTGDLSTWAKPVAPKDDSVVTRIHVTIRTGDDDLRGQSEAFGVVRLKGDRVHEFSLNHKNGWGNQHVEHVTNDLPAGTKLSDIVSFGLRHVSGKPDVFASYDNWNVDSVRVDYETRSGTLFALKGKPLCRFTAEQPERYFFQDAEVAATTPCEHVRVTLVTGGDDLRGNSEAFLAFQMSRGSPVEFSLNHKAGWEGGGRYHLYLRLPAGTKRQDIQSVTLRYVSGKEGPLDTQDNWSIDALTVAALEDPMALWVREYAQTVAAMPNRAVALGTDMNGMAPQVPFTALPVRYPLATDARLMPGLRALDKSKVGTREFDLGTDGVAHYGMLADFAQVAARYPEGVKSVPALFRTAEAVIKMWERVEASAKSVK